MFLFTFFQAIRNRVCLATRSVVGSHDRSEASERSFPNGIWEREKVVQAKMVIRSLPALAWFCQTKVWTPPKIFI